MQIELLHLKFSAEYISIEKTEEYNGEGSKGKI